MRVDEASARSGRLTMMDGASLVTGAAVASVHFRPFEEEISRQSAIGASFLLLAFAWLALTSAGPFVFLVRRFGRRREGYPAAPDLLWLAFGLPWTLAALYLSAAGSLSGRAGALYGNALFIGLSLASVLALIRVKRAWDAPPMARSPRRTWTEWIGSAVAVAWPLQLGLGFVVTK